MSGFFSRHPRLTGAATASVIGGLQLLVSHSPSVNTVVDSVEMLGCSIYSALINHSNNWVAREYSSKPALPVFQKMLTGAAAAAALFTCGQGAESYFSTHSQNPPTVIQANRPAPSAKAYAQAVKLGQ